MHHKDTKKTKKSTWHFLVTVPSVMVVIALLIGGYLYFNLNQELRLLLIIGFALSELVMILSALGGMIYLLTSEKSKHWLIINIMLFFIAGFNGVVMFLNSAT